jgi:short-subunit dehydrogenase
MALNPKITDWRGKRVWLVGGSTGIGEALAEQLHQAGARLVLSARGQDTLQALASRLPGALALPLDVTEPGVFETALARITHSLGGIEGLIFNAGTYEAVRAWELTPEKTRRVIEVNLIGAMNAVAAVVPELMRQRSGFIALVGSVAGYRGLPKALVYGASKSGLTHFAETLWLDLAPRGIGVFLVSPGFVATRLTAQNDFTMPGLISPEQAAQTILQGMRRGQFEIHFPKRFTGWMKFLECLPYSIYFRLVSRLTGL